MNLDHEIWCNPWDRRLASKASFPDLFRQCLMKCSTVYSQITYILTSTDPVTDEDITRLFDELGSYSYHSGLNVED